MILKKADAFIISSSIGLEVNTNEANYIRVRNVLAVLESDFGLPVAYHSEDCAQALPQSSNVLTIEKIKVFNDFKFLACSAGSLAFYLYSGERRDERRGVEESNPKTFLTTAQTVSGVGDE